MVRRFVNHTNRRYSAARKPTKRCTTGEGAMRRDESMRTGSGLSVGILRHFFRVEQTMQMHDEVAHMGIVHGLLSLGPPCLVGFSVIRIEPDDVDLAEILELYIFKPGEFSAEHKVQQLLRFCFSVHLWVSVPGGIGDLA